MSTLVVNSLKNSTGSSPTLTWPTADGTAGQILQSTNGTGTLAFDGAKMEAQDGTDLTFPDSAATNDLFKTDASGTLTTYQASNPYVQGDHDGIKLLDRYIFGSQTGGTNAVSCDLAVPSTITASMYDTIEYFVLVIRNVQKGNSGTWNPFVRYIDVDGSYWDSQTSTPYAFTPYIASSSWTYTNRSPNMGSMKFNIFQNGIHNTYNPSNKDLFVDTDTGGNAGNYKSVSNNCLNGEIWITAGSQPTMWQKDMEGYWSSSYPYRRYEHSYFNFVPDSSHSGTGKHPMGIQFGNDAGDNLTSGFVELYGGFRDGVLE